MVPILFFLIFLFQSRCFSKKKRLTIGYLTTYTFGMFMEVVVKL